MNITNIRLTVRDWDGQYLHERYASHPNPDLLFSIPADGFELTWAGTGDCLEATFQAIWSTVRIRARDIVDIDVQDELGNWLTIWAGVCTKSGNALVEWDHTNFKLVGLKKRLGEVSVPIDLPEGDVGAQARALLDAVTSRGDLGQAISGSAVGLPDVGVHLGPLAARGRRALEVLDYLAGQAGRAWFVDYARRVAWAPDADAESQVIELSEADEAGAVVPTFEDATGEALVTRVQVRVGVTDDGRDVLYTYTHPDWVRYGVSVEDRTLTDAQAWRVATWTYETQGVTVGGSPFERLADGRESVHVDGRAVTLAPEGLEGTFTQRLLEGAARIRVDVEVPGPGEAGGATEDTVVAQVIVTPPGAAAGDVRVLDVLARGAAGGRLTAWVDRASGYPAGTTVQVRCLQGRSCLVYELRPAAFNRAVLDRFAAFYVTLPERAPATVRVEGAVTPRRTLRLRRLLGDTYEAPVEVVRLLIKLDEPGVTILQVGQREPADAAAQRWLAREAVRAALAEAQRGGP